MPDKQNLPQRQSPLLPTSGDTIVDYKNLRLQERKALTAIQVLTFNGRHRDAAAAINSALGFECSTERGIGSSDLRVPLGYVRPDGEETIGEGLSHAIPPSCDNVSQPKTVKLPVYIVYTRICEPSS